MDIVKKNIGKKGGHSENSPVPLESSPARLRAMPDSEGYSYLLVIDKRTFIREALCGVLQASIGKQVIAISSVADLHTLPSSLNSLDTIVMYSTVDGAFTQSKEDLTDVRQTLDKCRICVLTDQIDRDYEELFENINLQGVIPSSFNTRQLSACLKIVQTGVPFLPIGMRATAEHEQMSVEADAAHFNELLQKLTPRQQQVMRYISIGKSNKFIAAELSLRESTVKVHVSELMKRLGATSRTHAVYVLNNRLKNTSIPE